jgi:hypothetical protein
MISRPITTAYESKDNTDPLMTIRDNVIDINAIGLGTYSYGIEVAYYRNSVMSGSIRHNTITLTDANFGILMINNINHNTSCNRITINEPADNYTSAIELRGGFHNRLSQNEIEGQYSTSSADEVNSLKIIESQENFLRANQTSDTEYGLHFSSLNNNTRQSDNAFKDHEVGYYIDPSGVTGWQWFSSNQWLGTFSNLAAWNENFPQENLYLDYSNLTTTDCWPQTISPAQGWFWPIQGNGLCAADIIDECIKITVPENEFSPNWTA